jgi:hypothetical protein
MIGNMPEVEFGYFGRVGLENADDMMGNITSDVDPIA